MMQKFEKSRDQIQFLQLDQYCIFNTGIRSTAKLVRRSARQLTNYKLEMSGRIFKSYTERRFLAATRVTEETSEIQQAR